MLTLLIGVSIAAFMLVSLSPIDPVIMGYIADTTGSMAIAFLIPLVCYGVIGTYALSKRHVPL